MHTGNVARKLGLLKRNQNDWKALEELMGVLRKFDPKDPGQWSTELIQEIIKEEKTKNIRLKTSIPIYLMYWTAAIDEHGNVYFTKDIYDRDPAIIKALN